MKKKLETGPSKVRDFRFGSSGGVSDLRDFKQIIFLYRSGEKFYALFLVGG